MNIIDHLGSGIHSLAEDATYYAELVQYYRNSLAVAEVATGSELQSARSIVAGNGSKAGTDADVQAM